MSKSITTIDRAGLVAVRELLNQELAAIGKKHGLKFTATNGSFSGGGTGKLTVEIAVVAKDGSVAHKGAELFTLYSTTYDVPASALGQTFTSNGGKQFILTGLSAARTKMPFFATGVHDGKPYKFPASIVAAAFAGKKASPAPAVKKPAAKTKTRGRVNHYGLKGSDLRAKDKEAAAKGFKIRIQGTGFCFYMKRTAQTAIREVLIEEGFDVSRDLAVIPLTTIRKVER